MAIQKIETYKTSDGNVFSDYEKAYLHEDQIKVAAFKKKWMESETCKRLIKDFESDEVYIWNIMGEGDLEKPRHLCFVQGTVVKVMLYALNLDNFFTHGDGGTISPIKIRYVK